MKDNMSFQPNGQLLIECFLLLKDPRVRGRTEYPLIEIIIISICAILCGANHWTSIAEFGESRKEWLGTFLPLENGIPPAQTIGRVFRMICPEALLNFFKQWCKETTCLPDNSIIAIDGKTLRKSSCKRRGYKALHLVNAYAVEQKILLDAYKTSDKSNG